VVCEKACCRKKTTPFNLDSNCENSRSVSKKIMTSKVPASMQWHVRIIVGKKRGTISVSFLKLPIPMKKQVLDKNL
jgi:hypothetical protein